MIRNITLGQYYPAGSLIHKLDPRVKLLATAVYVAVLFIINNFFGYALVFLSLSLTVYSSKVPPRFLLRGLKSLFILIIFTSVLNVFFSQGETVLLSVLGIKITLESVIMAVKMTARLILLICGTSLLTLTTSPIELTDAIERLLNPFRRVGVPAHEISMMMTIALRFIPTLLEETDKIMKAQTARGADFDTGGLIKKARSLLPLLIPLFISAFRRADELALAMEARCYRGGEGRTKMKIMRMAKRDFRAIAALAAFLAAAVAMNVWL